MFERFTDSARQVVVAAQEEARRLNHRYIGTEHVLLGLLSDGRGLAAGVLRDAGVTPAAVRSGIEELVGRGRTTPEAQIPFSARAKKVLELSLREALTLRRNYIGTEHILLGMLREGEGVAVQILDRHKVDTALMRERLLAQARSPRVRVYSGQHDEPLIVPSGTTNAARLERIQESLDRIERRLDALGAPADPPAGAAEAPEAPPATGTGPR